MSENSFPYMSAIGEFLADLASANPTPGGGAAAAVLGATGIALGEMVGNLTVGKKKYADVEGAVRAALEKLAPARANMLAMFAEDAAAYDAFGAALKLPKDTDEQKAARAEAMQSALKGATLTPDKTASLGLEAFRTLVEVAKVGNKNAISDCGVGALSLYGAIVAAALNMEINLPGIKDEGFRAEYGDKARRYQQEARELLDQTMAAVKAAMEG